MTTAITASLLKPIANWKKPILLTIVVTSVAAAVGAVFLSAHFAAIGYALLGLVTFVLYREDGSSTAQLQALTTQVGKENSQLQATTGQMAALNAQFQQQGQAFQQNRIAFENQIGQLQQETGRLQQAQRSWETQQRTLTQENQRLTQAKTALERDVANLNAAYSSVQTEVKQLLVQNLDFGRRVGAFQQDAGREAELTATIQRLDAGMNQDLNQAVQQMTAASHLVQGTIQFYSQQHQNFQNDLAQLAQNLVHLNQREADLNRLSANLQTNTEKYQQDLQNLHQLNEQLQKTRQELDVERTTIEQENKTLEDDRAKLAEESDRFSREFNQTKKDAEAVLAELAKSADLERRTLQVLEEKIKKGYADLAAQKNK